MEIPRPTRAALALGGCALLLLLMGLGLASEDASAVTFIVTDPGSSIQDAIDIASSGDEVLVMKGSYSEHLQVNKAITLRGDPDGGTNIWWSAGTVVSIGSRVVLRDLDIMGTYDAIGVGVTGNGCRLMNVNIRDCNYGVHITSNSFFEMERCTVMRCQSDALRVMGTADQRYENLTIMGSIFESNGGSGIHMERVRYVEMDNVRASKNQDWGIYAHKVFWVRLANSTLRTNDVGLKLYDSHGWTVEDTEVSWNRWDGIEINQSGAEVDNVFRRNRLTDNSRKQGVDHAGIALIGMDACDNLFEDNLIRGNPFGVRFNATRGCTRNTFLLNDIRNCNYAIWETPGAGPNTYIMNNFRENEHQALRVSEVSVFDDGERGNYWSDYLQHYPLAKKKGLVWDTPYQVIYGSSVFDRFPLTFPYEEDPPVIDLGADLNVSFGKTRTITALVQDASDIESHLWRITAPGGLETSYSTMEPETTFTFRRLGAFWVELTVTDIWGAASTDTVEYTCIDDVPPVAKAGEDIAVDLGTPVTLDGTASYDNNGIASLRWVVDPDGLDIRSTVSIVTLNIDALGMYTATLFLVDFSGNSASDQLIITIQDLSAPRAAATGDTTISLGGEGTFDGSTSSDNVGIVDWLWTVSWSGSKRTFTDPVLTFTFAELGTYTLVLRVTDAAGWSDHVQLSVRVIDTERPDADAGEDADVFMGTEVLFASTGSTDNVGITRYTWSFYYDGRARELEGRTASWRFDRPGEYQVTLMAYDEAGNFDTDVMRVTVRDSEPPVARFWSPEEGELGTSVVLDASGSDDNIGVTTYEWRVTHKGTVNNMTGVMANLPINTPGVYKVTLTVRDAAGNVDTVESSIYVPPKATVTETPGWLVPAMVVGVAAAVLVGWLVSRRYVGRNGT